ncbi:hypothetical protein [Sphingobium sp.]|uniref:DUF7662 domain-containing protein n=1 Tax=Sphingobium sp. TaxID=1912891 RepID=UPI0025DEF05D|nr:hypothetical protein [Sphingobium sp.]
MSKYDGLARYLTEQDDESITLSFEKVSAVVEGGLPQSAYDYRPWWANRYDGKDAQNQGWQSAGWETADVDMKRQKVTFNRTFKTRSSFGTDFIKPLTIEQAKAGLAVAFQVPVEKIEITIKG